MRAVVRRASAGDAAGLGALRLRALVESGRASGLDGGAFVAEFPSWVGEHGGSHLPFLAELDGEVVGMAWLMVAERVPTPERRHRRFGDVQSVYVLPELRNGGIGAALMAAVLAEAGALDLEFVTVHSSHGAVSLYRRSGFGLDEHWLRWSPE
jgi:GNAT superfamily N-acetyltransferase